MFNATSDRGASRNDKRLNKDPQAVIAKAVLMKFLSNQVKVYIMLDFPKTKITNAVIPIVVIKFAIKLIICIVSIVRPCTNKFITNFFYAF